MRSNISSCSLQMIRGTEIVLECSVIERVKKKWRRRSGRTNNSSFHLRFTHKLSPWQSQFTFQSREGCLVEWGGINAQSKLYWPSSFPHLLTPSFCSPFLLPLVLLPVQKAKPRCGGLYRGKAFKRSVKAQSISLLSCPLLSLRSTCLHNANPWRRMGDEGDDEWCKSKEDWLHWLAVWSSGPMKSSKRLYYYVYFLSESEGVAICKTV